MVQEDRKKYEFSNKGEWSNYTSLEKFFIFWRGGSKSAWHRVNNLDEILIYLRGNNLNLSCLDDDNKLIRNTIFDSNNPVEMIASSYLQAAKRTGEFTFLSYFVGAGFDFKDFELLRNADHISRLDKEINDLIQDILAYDF